MRSRRVRSGALSRAVTGLGALDAFRERLISWMARADRKDVQGMELRGILP